MRVSTADLKPAALTPRPKVQWEALDAAHCTRIFYRKMHPMGFEPMRVSTTELETVALDHSAKGAVGSPLATHRTYTIVYAGL